MKNILIKSISVDEEGRLCVFPNQTDQIYEFVYRAGNGTYWDAARGCFYPNKQKMLSHLDIFKQIYQAAVEELGISLEIDSNTKWEGLSSEEQVLINEWLSARTIK